MGQNTRTVIRLLLFLAGFVAYATEAGSDVSSDSAEDTAESRAVRLNPRQAFLQRKWGKVNTQIFKQCDKMKRGRLKESCRRIARQFYSYEDDSGTRAFATRGEDLKWYNEIRWKNVSARSTNINPFPEPGYQECELECPEAPDWPGKTSMNVRSLSPWKYCRHYDPHRFPQYMLMARCLCEGCLDPATMKESLAYKSAALKAQISVLRKYKSVPSFEECGTKDCENDLEEVTVGCHCFMPPMS